MTPRACTLALLIAATVSVATAAADDRGGGRIIDTPMDSAMPVEPAAFGDRGGNLVYTPVAPCRLLDTRRPSARSGPLGPDGQRDFLVFDADLDSEQGGNPLGCNLPAAVEAVAINLVAVDPMGPGFIIAWPAGQERPLAASLNLIPGQDLANQVTIGVNNAPGEQDMSLYAWAQTDVVADVVGYYARPESTPLACIDRYTAPWHVIEPGETRTVTSSACGSDSSLVSGHCDTGEEDDLQVLNAMVVGATQSCRMRNVGAVPHTVRVVLRCCRLPGR